MLLHYTTRTNKSRRLDSHQHEAVYGTAAFLNRATSAKVSGPRGSRTLISGVRSRRRPVGPAAQSVIPDGLEPSLPRCGPGVFAAGPRDQDHFRLQNSDCRLKDLSNLQTEFCNLKSIRSDQGESRTPTPVTARRSERRVSSISTTWPGSPYGNRTHPSGLRGQRPFADRRTGRQCVGQELNLHSSKAAALQAVRLTSAQPTHSQGCKDCFILHPSAFILPKSALWESNPPIWFGRPAPLPLGQGHMRKERELNPQGSSLGCFQDSCHRPLACPSVQAAAAGIEPAIVSLTGSRLTIGPHRKSRGQESGVRGQKTERSLQLIADS